MDICFETVFRCLILLDSKDLKNSKVENNQHTPGETENEWQKTEQVPILLLRGARSFFDAEKTKKKIFASLDFGDNPIYPISKTKPQRAS